MRVSGRSPRCLVLGLVVGLGCLSAERVRAQASNPPAVTAAGPSAKEPSVKQAPAANGTPLGATVDEVAKLYGPVLKANARVRNHEVLEGTVIDGNLYARNGLIIRVVYIKGRSVLLEYTRANGSLTFADVNPLLAATAGVSSWEPGKENTDTNKFYRRLDDKAVAHWTTENDGSLLISAEEGPGLGNRSMIR